MPSFRPSHLNPCIDRGRYVHVCILQMVSVFSVPRLFKPSARFLRALFIWASNKLNAIKWISVVQKDSPLSFFLNIWSHELYTPNANFHVSTEYMFCMSNWERPTDSGTFSMQDSYILEISPARSGEKTKCPAPKIKKTQTLQCP